MSLLRETGTTMCAMKMTTRAPTTATATATATVNAKAKAMTTLEAMATATARGARMWLLAGAMLALGACGTRTEVVVGVATDLSTPARIDRLRMRVTDGNGRLVVAREWPLSGPGAFKLPGSFGVGASSHGPFRVHVEGLRTVYRIG